MPKLQLLPFLSYDGKTNWKGDYPPDHNFCDGADNYILIERNNKFSLR